MKLEGALNLIITLVFLNLGLISMAITNIVEAVCKIVDLILLLWSAHLCLVSAARYLRRLVFGRDTVVHFCSRAKLASEFPVECIRIVLLRRDFDHFWFWQCKFVLNSKISQNIRHVLCCGIWNKKYQDWFHLFKHFNRPKWHLQNLVNIHSLMKLA